MVQPGAALDVHADLDPPRDGDERVVFRVRQVEPERWILRFEEAGLLRASGREGHPGRRAAEVRAEQRAEGAPCGQEASCSGRDSKAAGAGTLRFGGHVREARMYIVVDVQLDVPDMNDAFAQRGR